MNEWERKLLNWMENEMNVALFDLSVDAFSRICMQMRRCYFFHIRHSATPNKRVNSNTGGVDNLFSNPFVSWLVVTYRRIHMMDTL